ncbi:MAG TPA: exosome complex RNA-binding protein Csl4 [Candidatus Thermoplasmatota archaeon]|nr:exosome complex RNA-binding protein Csl4 [Candidatus Thermoplasmatota archaeon]
MEKTTQSRARGRSDDPEEPPKAPRAPLAPPAASGDILEPGTPLAYSEELLPGPGTYDDGTQIRAAVFGSQHIDPDTMAVSVVPAGKGVVSIERGDIIVGQITYIKPEALASIKILAVRGKEGRSLLQSLEGTLHASKIDARFVKYVDDEYRGGDLVRAKVIQIKGGPQLATDKPDLGCIKAWSRDGVPLVREGNKLKDPETGEIHHRKLANDYGSGTV